MLAQGYCPDTPLRGVELHYSARPDCLVCRANAGICFKARTQPLQWLVIPTKPTGQHVVQDGLFHGALVVGANFGAAVS
jgi:hypothetical protein